MQWMYFLQLGFIKYKLLYTYFWLPKYVFIASTYSAKAFVPVSVIVQTVRVRLPRNPFSIFRYPASLSFSIWTLIFPAEALVFSLIKRKSASSTEIRMDIMPNRSSECNKGFSSLNILRSALIIKNMTWDYHHHKYANPVN